MNGKKHIRITDIAPQQYAISLFSAAKCNLNCSYCYIHKDKKIVPEIHKKILKNIEDDSYLETIKYWFDPKMITAITHWGSEPTLTLLKFIPFYKKALNEFKNLNNISFSSNMMAKNAVNDIIEFCEFLADAPNPITFDLQISLDGPEEFTNANRVNGSYNIIISNMISLFEQLSYNKKITTSPLRFTSHIKPTLTMEQFKQISTYEKYNWFIKCFENVFAKIDNHIHNIDNINLNYNITPTLIYPGEYKKQDGITLAKVCKVSIRYNKKNTNKYVNPCIFYYDDFLKFNESLNFKYEKQHSFLTCSAGDTCPSIDEELNLVYCHNAFYNTNKDYREYVTNKKDASINYLSGREEIYDITKINKKDTKEDLIKKLIYNRAYSDSYKLKTATTAMLIMYYAKLGIISNVYKNKKIAELLSKFLVTARGCPGENILHTGSTMLTHSSIIIAFANGLFETLLKHHKENLKNDKTI